MNEQSILLIKLGATGDVVRTTALLRSLTAPVDWLTTSYNSSVLPANFPRSEMFGLLKTIWQIYSPCNSGNCFLWMKTGRFST
jgi:hypothetical protein